MNIVIFYGLIIVSFASSIYLGLYQINKSGRFLISFFSASLLNISILGLASVWWHITEVDPMSRDLGVMLYFIAMGVIGVINLIVLLLVKEKRA